MKRRRTAAPALRAGALTLTALRSALREPATMVLTRADQLRVRRSRAVIENLIARGETAYGVNTGFGMLASNRISTADLERLQHNLVLSHAAGTGAPLSDAVVRLVLVLKIASLAQGCSGVRPQTLRALQALLRAGVYPVHSRPGLGRRLGRPRPAGAPAPVLLGVGEVRYQGRVLPAKRGLAIAGLRPLRLAAKEGLALLNGTQVSTALALAGLFAIEDVFAAALLTGAMSVDAVKGLRRALRSAHPRSSPASPGRSRWPRPCARCCAAADPRLAPALRRRVQDPYSLRCQPQVMGACLDLLNTAAATLLREANAVTDNPLVFARDDLVLSGGNFHAEPVAFAADQLALAVARDRLDRRAPHRDTGRHQDERAARRSWWPTAA